MIVPAGGYGFNSVTIGYHLGPQRTASGSLWVERGTFYNGDKTTIGYRRGRVKITSKFFLEPTYSINGLRSSRARSRSTWPVRGSPTR